MVQPSNPLEHIFLSLDKAFENSAKDPNFRVDNTKLNRIPNRIMAKYLDSRQHSKGDMKTSYKNALEYYEKQTPPQKRITAFFKAAVQGDNKLLELINKEKVISEIANKIEEKLEDFLKKNEIIKGEHELNISNYRSSINDFAKDMADLNITNQDSLNLAKDNIKEKFYKSLSVFFRKVSNQLTRDTSEYTTMGKLGIASGVKRGIFTVNNTYENEIEVITKILDHLISES